MPKKNVLITKKSYYQDHRKNNLKNSIIYEFLKTNLFIFCLYVGGGGELLCVPVCGGQRIALKNLLLSCSSKDQTQIYLPWPPKG